MFCLRRYHLHFVTTLDGRAAGGDLDEITGVLVQVTGYFLICGAGRCDTTLTFRGAWRVVRAVGIDEDHGTPFSARREFAEVQGVRTTLRGFEGVIVGAIKFRQRALAGSAGLCYAAVRIPLILRIFVGRRAERGRNTLFLNQGQV